MTYQPEKCACGCGTEIIFENDGQLPPGHEYEVADDGCHYYYPCFLRLPPEERTQSDAGNED